ncbi:hypothetical protein M9H77_22054 [Catharanthus roseus]|uniref:Uncharacterized protein n=1 Tax=Catharanthus roseus TaxID=4058 RepID=A0ACC0ATE7_CATRO|nr:hypothetical protein M9H77_22054 [Catharanthus roseus]
MVVGNDEKQVYNHQETNMKKKNGGISSRDPPRHVQWVIIETDQNDHPISSLSDDSFESVGQRDEDSSRISEASSSSSSSSSSSYSSSSDLVEDAESPPSNFGPLFELSELMNQLPIKRGLSKFYQGKSQSFTSLAKARSIEDLAKKVSPNYNRRMKSCKSYGGFEGRKFGPKATITKKSSKGSFLSSCLSGSSRGNFARHL